MKPQMTRTSALVTILGLITLCILIDIAEHWKRYFPPAAMAPPPPVSLYYSIEGRVTCVGLTDHSGTTVTAIAHSDGHGIMHDVVNAATATDSAGHFILRGTKAENAKWEFRFVSAASATMPLMPGRTWIVAHHNGYRDDTKVITNDEPFGHTELMPLPDSH